MIRYIYIQRHTPRTNKNKREVSRDPRRLVCQTMHARAKQKRAVVCNLRMSMQNKTTDTNRHRLHSWLRLPRGHLDGDSQGTTPLHEDSDQDTLIQLGKRGRDAHSTNKHLCHCIRIQVGRRNCAHGSYVTQTFTALECCTPGISTRLRTCILRSEAQALVWCRTNAFEALKQSPLPDISSSPSEGLTIMGLRAPTSVKD